jgi:hypothetical protein
MKMLKEIRIAVVFIIYLAIIIAVTACGSQAKPAVKLKFGGGSQQKDAKNPAVRTDSAFDSAQNVSRYFTLKTYEGATRLYTDKDLVPPKEIEAELAYLGKDGINYSLLLRDEIAARHSGRLTNPVSQKIFNLTFWYDQKASKKGVYDESMLNETEKGNVAMLEKEVGAAQKENLIKIAEKIRKDKMNEVTFKAYNIKEGAGIYSFDESIKNPGNLNENEVRPIKHDIIAKLKMRDGFEVLDSSSRWFFVRGMNSQDFSTYYGWILKEYTTTNYNDFLKLTNNSADDYIFVDNEKINLPANENESDFLKNHQDIFKNRIALLNKDNQNSGELEFAAFNSNGNLIRKYSFSNSEAIISQSEDGSLETKSVKNVTYKISKNYQYLAIETSKIKIISDKKNNNLAMNVENSEINMYDKNLSQVNKISLNHSASIESLSYNGDLLVYDYYKSKDDDLGSPRIEVINSQGKIIYEYPRETLSALAELSRYGNYLAVWKLYDNYKYNDKDMNEYIEFIDLTSRDSKKIHFDYESYHDNFKYNLKENYIEIYYQKKRHVFSSVAKIPENLSLLGDNNDKN